MVRPSATINAKLSPTRAVGSRPRLQLLAVPHLMSDLAQRAQRAGVALQVPNTNPGRRRATTDTCSATLPHMAEYCCVHGTQDLHSIFECKTLRRQHARSKVGRVHA